MKKICFIINRLNGGGAERVISVISSNLCKDYDITIILLMNTEEKMYEVNKKVKIVQLNKYHSKKEQLMKTPRDLSKIMIELNADIYISFCTMENVMSLLANFKAHKTLIIAERNSPKTEEINPIFKVLRKLLYKYADKYVFQTEEAMSYYSKKIQQRGYVIPNPVKDNLPETEYESTKIISAVGRLNKQKNYPLLITAFSNFIRMYPEYILEIYGEGIEKNNICELIIQYHLEDKVILKGFSENVHEHIRKSEFYIMTSDYEGMPNALLEALAIGLPCISADCPVGGPRELIGDNRNGFLFEVGNYNDLLDKMCILADDKVLREKLGRKAKEYIRYNYSIEKITEQWERVITENT